MFQRPGSFRWVYDKPVDQLIVGDGERVWIYDRDLNQVTVRKLSRALGSTPAALLAGSNEVEKAFELSRSRASATAWNGWRRSRRRARRASSASAWASARRGIQAMELIDHFGQTTLLRFSGLARNPKVDPPEFRFEPPEGRRRPRREVSERSAVSDLFGKARARRAACRSAAPADRSTRSSASAICWRRASRCASPSSRASRIR